MKAKGRPILGAISGFFGFLFLAVDLVLFGAIKFNSPLVTILPIIGLVLGVLWGFWAPIGATKVERQVADRRAAEQRAETERTLAAARPQPASVTDTGIAPPVSETPPPAPDEFPRPPAAPPAEPPAAPPE